jgi:excisionase family DNA binding protein
MTGHGSRGDALTAPRRPQVAPSQRMGPASIQQAMAERSLRRVKSQELGPSAASAPPSPAVAVKVVPIDDLVAQVSAVVEAQLERVLDLRDEYLSRDEVAQLLDLSTKTVSRLARDEGLPHSMIGNDYRFSRLAVSSWIKSRQRSEGEGTPRK